MKTGLFNFSGFGRRISTGLRGIVAAFHAVSARMTLALVSMALIGGMASCTFDDTDLQNSIDDLTSRVEALEDFQEQVQGDIASLQDIISKLDSSVTVNNVVDNGDGSWTINFSDGTSVTIRNGQDGEDGLTPPSITVVEEDGTYYWAYEDEDGNTDFILDDDGNKIPVSGEAPRVRINDEGYWEISSDGGKTWEDTGVKAEGGSGESIFFLGRDCKGRVHVPYPVRRHRNQDSFDGGTCLRLRDGRGSALLYGRREQDIGLHHERSGDLHYNQA